MKVFISVDIEGVAGVAHWDEALKGRPDHEGFRDLMAAEAAAACEGARAAGATDTVVRDAHQTARNIDPARLPDGVRLVHGWSGHPFKMMQGLDESFDAVAMIGWHGPAGDGGNPLSHTMTGRFAAITLNGAPLSEYLLHAHLAATCGVPVVFLSGDAAMCRLAQETNPAIGTLATKEGHGASIVSLTPAEARRRITEGVTLALTGDHAGHTLPAADGYELKLRFHAHELAYEKAFYPGARLVAADTVAFDAERIFDIARALCFM